MALRTAVLRREDGFVGSIRRGLQQAADQRERPSVVVSGGVGDPIPVQDGVTGPIPVDRCRPSDQPRWRFRALSTLIDLAASGRRAHNWQWRRPGFPAAVGCEHLLARLGSLRPRQGPAGPPAWWAAVLAAATTGLLRRLRRRARAAVRRLPAPPRGPGGGGRCGAAGRRHRPNVSSLSVPGDTPAARRWWTRSRHSGRPRRRSPAGWASWRRRRGRSLLHLPAGACSPRSPRAADHPRRPKGDPWRQDEDGGDTRHDHHQAQIVLTERVVVIPIQRVAQHWKDLHGR